LVSADVPPTQVADGKQNWTYVRGALVRGAKVGTGSSAVVDDGDAFGEAFGDVLGDVPGEWVATLLDDPPRVAWKTPYPIPTRRRSTTTMAAGTNHGGRSVCTSRTGRRGAGGLRAGVGTGTGIGAEGGTVLVG
jgi:hypothetical protein